MSRRSPGFKGVHRGLQFFGGSGLTAWAPAGLCSRWSLLDWLKHVLMESSTCVILLKVVDMECLDSDWQCCTGVHEITKFMSIKLIGLQAATWLVLEVRAPFRSQI